MGSRDKGEIAEKGGEFAEDSMGEECGHGSCEDSRNNLIKIKMEGKFIKKVNARS